MKKTKYSIFLMLVVMFLAFTACNVNSEVESADETVSIPEQEFYEEENSQEKVEPSQVVNTDQITDAMQNFAQGQQVQTSEEIVIDVNVYDRFLVEIYSMIASNSEDMLDIAGMMGVYEATRDLTREEALAQVGYNIQDINGDGVAELMIGSIIEETNSKFYGSLLYAVYTYSEGEPKCLLEGYARNRVSWLGDNLFLTNGSGGALYYICGIYELAEDSTELQCVDYYFTHEKDNNYEDIRVYYNTSGEWDITLSQEWEYSLDEFWTLVDEYDSQIKEVEFTPITE